MKRSLVRTVLPLAVVVAAFVFPSCSKPQPKNDTVADVNGEPIRMTELREFLGMPGGFAPVAGITAEQKKEALGRLIAGRLLAQEARVQGLDNTDEFRSAMKGSERSALITALFRKEVASSGAVSKDEIRAEAKKMMAADNTLSDNNANLKAQQSVSEAKIRKIQQDLIAAANKEFPGQIIQPAVDRIVKGEKVPDDAVLATAAGDNVTYGALRARLEQLSGAMHGSRDIARNPVAINRLLTREMTGRSLAAYAKKQGIEGTEWFNNSRADIERTVLVDLMAAQVLEKGDKPADEEVEAYYKEHPEMFVRQGKKVPFAMIKEQLRDFLRMEKRKSAMQAYIEELREKAKVTVNEKVLGEV